MCFTYVRVCAKGLLNFFLPVCAGEDARVCACVHEKGVEKKASAPWLNQLSAQAGI